MDSFDVIYLKETCITGNTAAHWDQKNGAGGWFTNLIQTKVQAMSCKSIICRENAYIPDLIPALGLIYSVFGGLLGFGSSFPSYRRVSLQGWWAPPARVFFLLKWSSSRDTAYHSSRASSARVCVELSFFCTGCLPRLVDPVCPVEGVLGYQVSRVGVGQGVVPVSLSARLRTRMAQTPVVI